MIASLLVYGGLFAYFLVFRFYGFPVEDEGTLLFQLTRVQRGQIPYVDFHTGYTPGYFYFCAWLLELLGNSTATMRVFLAALNAATATALYRLARRFVGPWMALLPPVAWVSFIPTYIGDFAAFNVPYPAWFAGFAWVLLALTMVRWAESGSLRWVVVAGLLCAAAFAVKLNAGAYAFAAATWVIVGCGVIQGKLERSAAGAASLAMIVGVWFSYGFAWRTLEAWALLLPAFVVAGLYSSGIVAAACVSRGGRVLPALLTLAIAFLGPSLLWIVPVLSLLGAETFARDVLFIGSDAAELYHLPYPLPTAYGAAAIAGVLALAVVARMSVRQLALGPALVVVGGVVAVAGSLVLSKVAMMPEGPGQALVDQVQLAAFWLTPLVHWGAIAWVVRRHAHRGEAVAMAVILPLAAAMYLQVYPRSDFIHLLMSVSLSTVLGTALLARVKSWITAGRWPSWANAEIVTSAVLATAVVGLVSVKIGPVTVAAFEQSRSRNLQVDTGTVIVGLEPAASDDLEGFGLAAEYIERHAREGEPILSFPALSGLLFATGNSNAVHHDYWYPGRPDSREEARMLETLRATPPRFVVTLNDGWGFFTGSPQYYAAARDFVTGRYLLVARFGRFDILADTDTAAGLPRVSWIQTGPSGAAVEQVLPWRRQAARRWMADLDGQDIDAVRLESDTRRATLRLAAIRDGGDMRAAAWIVEGYRSKDARVRHEALSAMKMVAERHEAARARWAGDFDDDFYLDYVSTFAEEVRSWSDKTPPVSAFRSSLLSVIDNDGR